MLYEDHVCMVGEIFFLSLNLYPIVYILLSTWMNQMERYDFFFSCNPVIDEDLCSHALACFSAKEANYFMEKRWSINLHFIVETA